MVDLTARGPRTVGLVSLFVLRTAVHGRDCVTGAAGEDCHM